MVDERSDANGPPDPEIKVTDRRQFSAEGERLGDDVEDDAAPVQEGPPETEELPAGASFDGLVMGLVGTALVHLGEIPDAAGETGTVDLPAAREAIDLLGILGEKTAGNLAPEEQQFLDRWLSSVRMMFTERAQPR